MFNRARTAIAKIISDVNETFRPETEAETFSPETETKTETLTFSTETFVEGLETLGAMNDQKLSLSSFNLFKVITVKGHTEF